MGAEIPFDLIMDIVVLVLLFAVVGKVSDIDM